MADWQINVPLDIPQENVLRLNESKVITGSAGSGKTLLAVHKAKNLQASKKGTFYFIVLTKALRRFISSGVQALNIPDTKVLYAWEWKKYDCPSADYIMIDEAQDFGEEDINLFKDKAKKVVMFFGDTAQQVYENTTKGDPCVSMDDIKSITALDEITLLRNHRLYPAIAKVAQYLNPDEDIVSKCTKSGGSKPIVKQFDSQSEELDWIVEQIKDRQLKDVGILLPRNMAEEEGNIDGVFETFNYLKDKGLSLGVKYTKNKSAVENLDFKSDTVNIMTYHSAKGLQFKTVFLPFCESDIDDYFWQKAFYVALTRTSENLIITYTNEITPFLLDPLNNNLLQVI